MKIFETWRLKRENFSKRIFSARALCLAGLIIMPALLFNPSTPLRVMQFLFFWFLLWLSGKKNNFFLTLLVILGIVVCNLLVPYGRILWEIGVFKITAGALAAGIHRAVTLEGLIMLSRVCIRPDLRIPGAFGELVGESFRIFSLITERKGLISRKDPIAGIDRLMIELSETETTADSESEAPRKRFPGLFIIIVVSLLAWLPWLIIIPGLPAK